MFKKRTLVGIGGVLAASLVLTACSAGNPNDASGPSGSSSDNAATFNDQDVMFAQGMVVHHTQAIDMAQTILDKDGIDLRVIQLAEDIKEAQAPEIDQLNGFLDQWGAPSEMNAIGGMMSESDMADLEAATGVEASRLFLEQMTEHHMGAVDMAQMEVDHGQDPDATALAQKMIDDQTSELALMEELLASL